MTYIYQDSFLIGPVTMEKPVEPKKENYGKHDGLFQSDYYRFECDMGIYNYHLSTLPRYPVQGEHKWINGQEVIEGKDFIIENRCEFYRGGYSNTCTLCKELFHGSDKLWFYCQKCCNEVIAKPIKYSEGNTRIKEISAIFEKYSSDAARSVGKGCNHTVYILEKDFWNIIQEIIKTIPTPSPVVHESGMQEALTIDDYKEAFEDHKRLVRELDFIINGSSAAKQASLCDLVAQCENIFKTANTSEQERQRGWTIQSSTGVDEIDETNFKYPTYEQAGGDKKWDDMSDIEKANYDNCKYLNALAVYKNTVKRLRKEIEILKAGYAASEGEKSNKSIPAPPVIGEDVEEGPQNYLDSIIKRFSRLLNDGDLNYSDNLRSQIINYGNLIAKSPHVSEEDVRVFLRKERVIRSEIQDEYTKLIMMFFSETYGKESIQPPVTGDAGDDWISVEEQLPDIHEVAGYSNRVLCITSSGLMAVGYILHGSWCKDGSASSFKESGYTITRWRPLPKPPKQ